MAVTMIDGPVVRVQLAVLKMSITEFAASARMARSEVSRALSGHPTEPATVFRLALRSTKPSRARDERTAQGGLLGGGILSSCGAELPPFAATLAGGR